MQFLALLCFKKLKHVAKSACYYLNKIKLLKIVIYEWHIIWQNNHMCLYSALYEFGMYIPRKEILLKVNVLLKFTFDATISSARQLWFINKHGNKVGGF